MTIRKERPMRKVSPLLLAASVALSCGTSNPSNRRLQSITINVLGRGGQVQFTATGNFSSPPLTVTPLPVSWSLGLMAPRRKLCNIRSRLNLTSSSVPDQASMAL